MISEEDPRPSEPNRKPVTEGAQSIRRAVKVLNAVATGGPGGRRLTDIANMVGLHLATTRRILMGLVEEGMLQLYPAQSTYALGPLMLYFGQRAKQQHIVMEPLRPYLEEVARRSGDTVLLSTRSDDDSICLLRVEGTFPIRTMTLSVGSVRPLGVGAGSLALLAWLPVSERERILGNNASRFVPYSMDIDQVRRLCDRSRKLGYALNDGLILEGVSGIGIPVADPGGDIVASISITAVSSRLDRSRSQELNKMVGEVFAGLDFWTVLTTDKLKNYRGNNEK